MEKRAAKQELEKAAWRQSSEGNDLPTTKKTERKQTKAPNTPKKQKHQNKKNTDRTDPIQRIQAQEKTWAERRFLLKQQNSKEKNGKK